MIKKSNTETCGPVEYASRLNFCADITKLGARPVISAHISGVSRKDAISIYVDVHGERPSRGMLPSSSSWFFASKDRAIQATSFLEIFLKLSNEKTGKSKDEVDRTIYEAYRVFKSMAGKRNDLIEFDRCWSLVMVYRAKEVTLHECKVCKSKTLIPVGTPSSLVNCLTCSS